MDLDPRNAFVLRQISLNYVSMRRYPEAASVLDRALEIAPKDVDARVGRAIVDFQWHADTGPMHSTIRSLRTENAIPVGQLADQWLNLALLERDLDECDQALAALSGNTFLLGGSDAVRFNRAFGEGLIERVRGNGAAARAAFATARSQQEEVVRTQPDYAPALCVLGVIDAGLGRKEDALREGRRAVELLPVAKDSINGAHMIEYFAIIAAWCGDKDLALEQLANTTRVPGYISYGYLHLHPLWDPLRGDPRFEQLVEESKKPVALK
jgi:tetratricopeptide (TPR) repeat protein